MFVTMTAKKDGTCKRCGGEILTGTQIRWARGVGAYHLAKACPASEYYQGGESAQGAARASSETAPVSAPSERKPRARTGRTGKPASWHAPDIDRLAEMAMEEACGIR